MNKITFTSLFLAAMTLSSCGSHRSAASEPASASNSNVSFSFYDISSSVPSITQNDRVANTAASSNTVSDIGGGGGGGGGGAKEENVVERQNVAIQPLRLSLKQASTSQTNPIMIERKIILNAELSLEFERPEEEQKRITTIAQSKGGFVVESQQSSSDVRTKTNDIILMTVRVPAEKFNETLEEIRKSADRIIIETIKGQDVTEEFIDIEARLKAKKALELQFMEIMKRANSVEDALSVQSELAEVRGEIEKIEGRKRFLENQASLSTIKIRLQTPAALSASSSGFGYRLAESFGSGFDVALNFILGLVTFIVAVIPFALFIGLPGYLIVRYILKESRRMRTAAEIALEEIKSE